MNPVSRPDWERITVGWIIGLQDFTVIARALICCEARRTSSLSRLSDDEKGKEAYERSTNKPANAARFDPPSHLTTHSVVFEADTSLAAQRQRQLESTSSSPKSETWMPVLQRVYTKFSSTVPGRICQAFRQAHGKGGIVQP